MEKINYSQLIQDILTQHSDHDSKNHTETQLLFDTKRLCQESNLL